MGTDMAADVGDGAAVASIAGRSHMANSRYAALITFEKLTNFYASRANRA
jgi:hypothetical protein